MFDRAWYLQRNTDVAAAGADALWHYLTYGAMEGRDPSPLFATIWYEQHNQDAGGAHANPLLHYLCRGAIEGRDPHPLFSSSWYLQRYPDVAASGLNALVHYLLHGAAERRDPHPLFCADWYLRRYPDVVAAGLNPLAHYWLYGRTERRDPNPLFSSTWYAEQNPDVAAAKVDPLLHYLSCGATEGRDPHPQFCTSWYVERYPEVVASGVNALAHYLRRGAAEGRAPHGRLSVDSVPKVTSLRLDGASVTDLSSADMVNSEKARDDRTSAYDQQILREAQNFILELPELLRHIEVMIYRPFFVVVVGAHDEDEDDKGLKRTLESLQQQVYPHWRVCEPTEDLASRLLQPDDNAFLVWLDAGDILSRTALYAFACALNREPLTDLVYADEDCLGPDGRRSQPFYKPDWSPDTLESFNYIGPAACFRGSRAATCWSQSLGYYEFVLRFTERTCLVQHIREIVCHRSQGAADRLSADQVAANIAALDGRLRRTGRTGTIGAVASGFGCYDAKIALSSHPLVSIVIPTAGRIVDLDDGRHVDLLFNCLDTVAQRSTYRNLEIVVVDNGDLGDVRIKALRHRGCKTITFPEQEFNVAKKLNLGVSIAGGNMLLLLNDDVEPIAADWIERLLEHFEKPHVGVVGAKLLYADGRIQHVGVVTNHANPDHVRRRYPRDDPGYFFSTCTVRNFAAVTGACMMTRADTFRAVGGYNERLAISFNDVDYCLKIRELGLTVVYAPRAELTHFESCSRSPVLDMSEYSYFQKRWAHMVTSDPFYNEESLALAPPTFEVSHNPRLL